VAILDFFFNIKTIITYSKLEFKITNSIKKIMSKIFYFFFIIQPQ